MVHDYFLVCLSHRQNISLSQPGDETQCSNPPAQSCHKLRKHIGDQHGQSEGLVSSGWITATFITLVLTHSLVNFRLEQINFSPNYYSLIELSFLNRSY